MSFEPAYMGQFLRTYKPPLLNVNSALNYLLVPQKVVFQPAAIITRVVQFPDVSFYQRDIDWDKMASQTKAVIIRIGQNLWPDTKFERNYAEARKRGLLIGGYWFYDGRVSPVQQADLLERLMDGKTFEMEVFIDWEKNYGGAWEGLPRVVSMMESVEDRQLDVLDVGMYTGYYFFRSNSNSIANANQYNYLKAKPLWEAWYTSNPANVLIPAPWTLLTHWQFGTPVVDWGQETSELDMNFFNGSAEEFNNRYSAVVPGEPMPYYELRPSVLGEWRSIRLQTNYPSVPHIFGGTSEFSRIQSGSYAKAIDSYTYDQDVYVNSALRAKAGDKWWKVYEANGLAITDARWVAEKHLGFIYLSTKFTGDIEPPSDEYILHVKDGVARKFILSNE
jgi:GH25 family lysozyme M1 (1,4-beta-N-acetylmuramidase)